MKHMRSILLLLTFALVLTGCGTYVQEPYEYSRDGWAVLVYPEESVIRIFDSQYHYTIEDQGSRVSYNIIFPDGSTYYWTATESGGMGGWSEDFDEDQLLFADFLVDALEYPAPREYSGHPILALVFLGFGGLALKAPELMFCLNKGWMFRDAEPSNAYLAMSRIGGVIMILVGIVMFFV